MYLPSILEESLPLSYYQSLYSFIQVRYLNGHCDAIDLTGWQLRRRNGNIMYRKIESLWAE